MAIVEKDSSLVDRVLLEIGFVGEESQTALDLGVSHPGKNNQAAGQQVGVPRIQMSGIFAPRQESIPGWGTPRDLYDVTIGFTPLGGTAAGVVDAYQDFQNGTFSAGSVGSIFTEFLPGPNLLNRASRGIESGASRLVGANKATIDPRKLTDYALNLNHPAGGNKARVFESALGFNQSNVGDLMVQLQKGVMNNTPVAGKIDQYGSRFTVDIPVTGPKGNGTVRTGWIFKPGAIAPEMTTLFVK
jgi:hypothetical protein